MFFCVLHEPHDTHISRCLKRTFYGDFYKFSDIHIPAFYECIACDSDGKSLAGQVCFVEKRFIGTQNTIKRNELVGLHDDYLVFRYSLNGFFSGGSIREAHYTALWNSLG